jgi:hypothetical protein
MNLPCAICEKMVGGWPPGWMFNDVPGKMFCTPCALAYAAESGTPTIIGPPEAADAEWARVVGQMPADDAEAARRNRDMAKEMVAEYPHWKNETLDYVQPAHVVE